MKMKFKLKHRICIYAIFIAVIVGSFVFVRQPVLHPVVPQPINFAAKTVDELLSLANAGDAEAQYRLGRKYEKGEGVAQDFKQAAEWYQKAASQDLATAHNAMGNLYVSGTGVPLDYEHALRWYQSAATLGDADALANIGRMYDNGYGVKHDKATALEWYRKAASKGHAYAENYMGLAYKDGTYVPQSYETALDYFRASAEHSFPYGQANLGEMYRAGMGVEKNLTEAGKWYKLAADNGLIEAQSYIRQVQTDCSKNSKNDGDVVYDLNSCFFAAATDDAQAMHAVGLAYLAGRGVPKDAKVGVSWLTKAAKAGTSGAQVQLAVAYDEGNGVPKDAIEAYAWFSAAQSQRDLNDLQVKVISVGKQSTLKNLSVADREKAERKALEYVYKFGQK